MTVSEHQCWHKYNQKYVSTYENVFSGVGSFQTCKVLINEKYFQIALILFLIWHSAKKFYFKVEWHTLIKLTITTVSFVQ